MPIDRAESTPTVQVQIPRDQFENYLKSANNPNVQQADEPSWAATVQNLIVSAGLLYGAGYVLYQNHDAILEFGRTHVGPLAGRVICALKVAMQDSVVPPAQDIPLNTTSTLGDAAGKAYDAYTWFSRIYLFHYFVTKNAPMLVTLGAIGGIVTGTFTKPFTFAARVLLPKTNSTTGEKVAKVATLALIGAGIILTLGCWDQLQHFAEKGTCEKTIAVASNLIGDGRESAAQVGGSALALQSDSFAIALSPDQSLISKFLTAFNNPEMGIAIARDACAGATCPSAKEELKKRVITFLHNQKENVDTGAKVFTAVNIAGPAVIAGAVGSLLTGVLTVGLVLFQRGARLAGAI